MVTSYRIDDLELGNPSQTGHVVYTKAKLRQGRNVVRVIYKENKSGKSLNSHLEVAFSGLASLYLQPKLTANQSVVVNNQNRTVGLLSEHLCYTIADREPANTVFYSVKIDKNGTKYGEQNPQNKEDIPITFFDSLPPGSFAKLTRDLNDKKITFDMDSLASVLTTSYTLEEDDLHKGNFGFYSVKKYNPVLGIEQPHLVFFKIDHDLMLADSLMSHGSARIVNWRLDENAYAITRRDLIRFPKIVDSSNHYWPTEKRLFVNPSDSKIYSDYSEIKAFKKLGNNLEFKQAKWLAFYKHILISSDLTKQSLYRAFDKNNPEGRAQITMINNAVDARISRLKSVLFSIPEFRDFVCHLSPSKLASIRQEILCNVEDTEQEKYKRQFDLITHRYQQLCQPNGCFDPTDTPLHVAIRLGDYRFDESWQSFKKYAEIKNSAGERPLDLAIEQAENIAATKTLDARKNPLFIAKHLLKMEVSATDSYRALNAQKKTAINEFQLKSVYITKATKATTNVELLNLFQDLSEDKQLTLKMKKDISLICLNEFITAMNGNNDQLKKALLLFRTSLNGDDLNPPAPELQFIRQLRSSLWLIRQIRGLLGGTSTQIAINERIDDVLNALESKNHFTFFCFPSRNVEDMQNQRIVVEEPETITRVI